MNKVYIDEECNLCTSYGNWISNKNKSLDIKFQADLSSHEINLDTLVYKKNGDRFYYSDAVINSISDLGGIYVTIKVLKIFPKIIRDNVYKIISKFRNKF